ncbi:hypothetical protein HK101_001759 [Irineochytrium annulatum]|nr:hypothetical protein HK101_001759 [Irineochytrium annulatum]
MPYSALPSPRHRRPISSGRVSTEPGIGGTPRAATPNAMASVLESGLERHLTGRLDARNLDLSTFARVAGRAVRVARTLTDATAVTATPATAPGSRQGGGGGEESIEALKRDVGARERRTRTREAASQATRANTAALEAEALANGTSRPYKEMLLGAVEYVALFRVNRPVQSDVTTVEEVRSTEDTYAALMRDMMISVQEVQTNFDGKVAGAIQELALWLASKAEKLEKAHNIDVETVRSAYRARYSDALARIAYLYQNKLKEASKVIEAQHIAKGVEMDHEIFRLKKETHHRVYEVSKMRSHVARYQFLLRKHSINETDKLNPRPQAYLTVDDERVKTEDVVAHYQQTLLNREEKYNELVAQLNQAEAYLESQGWRGNTRGTDRAAGAHAKDHLDASVTSIDGAGAAAGFTTSRRTSLNHNDPRVAGVKAIRTRRNSAESEFTVSDAGGGSRLSLASFAGAFGGANNAANASLGNISMPVVTPGAVGAALAGVAGAKTPGGVVPPSRERHVGRTFYSDLSRVVERAGDTSASRAQRPGRRGDIGGSSAALAGYAAEGYYGSGGGEGEEMDEEEAQVVVAQIRDMYEERIRAALEANAVAADQERADIMRINGEFQAKFEEMRGEIGRDQDVNDQLATGQRRMVKVVNTLFPFGARPNRVHKGTQCNLDNLDPLETMSAKLVFSVKEQDRLDILPDGLAFSLTIPKAAVHVENKLFVNLIVSSPDVTKYNGRDFKCGSDKFDVKGSDSEGYTVTSTFPRPPVDLVGYYIWRPVLIDSPDAQTCKAYIDDPNTDISNASLCVYWDGIGFQDANCDDIHTVPGGGGTTSTSSVSTQTSTSGPTSSSLTQTSTSASTSASVTVSTTTSAAVAVVTTSTACDDEASSTHAPVVSTPVYASPKSTQAANLVYSAAVGSKAVSGIAAFVIAGAVLAMF